jgi:hypothetical protein
VGNMKISVWKAQLFRSDDGSPVAPKKSIHWEPVGKDIGSNLAVNDIAKICITVSKDGYAKIWDEGPGGKSVLVPNEYTSELGYVTSENDALKVNAKERVCVGDMIGNELPYALQIQQNEKGPHRIYVQWADSPSKLYDEQDYPVLTRTLGDSRGVPENDLSTEQKARLSQSKNYGVSYFSYYVK